MAHYIIATIKSWNIENSRMIIGQYPEHSFTLVTGRDGLTCAMLEKLRPEYIFFPHWSWLIPKSIYSNFNCVVFHMTDLPFGRGGSPLQNLLIRGIYETKVSAIKAGYGMDTGPVYCKEALDISKGNADDILRRVSDIVFKKMIPRFWQEEMVPEEQVGEPVIFNRRTPEQSEIPEGLSQRQIYDYIRMLDGEGYPTAFSMAAGRKIFYRNARLIDGVVYADAEFERKSP